MAAFVDVMPGLTVTISQASLHGMPAGSRRTRITRTASQVSSEASSAVQLVSTSGLRIFGGRSEGARHIQMPRWDSRRTP